ncbi:hypothetical protein DW955_11770 [Ruminococcus sp. AM45-9BH]|nr:hypothetical protein DW955_11770 [Ruminococcus sp. AM45-9BH]
MGYVKDIKDLKIDASLGKEERILSYLEQMENPYEYQDGDTRVRIRFSDTEKTLTDQLISYISEKQSYDGKIGNRKTVDVFSDN